MDTNISEIRIKGIFKLNMNAIFKIISRIGLDIDPTLDQVMGPILMYVQSKCSPTFCEFKADRKRSCFKNLTLDRHIILGWSDFYTFAPNGQ